MTELQSGITEDEVLQMAWSRPSTSEVFTSCAIVGSAAAYRPLTLLAENNWDLGSPEVLVLAFFGLVVLQVLVLLVAVLCGAAWGPAAATVGALTLVLMGWERLPIMAPVFWVIAVGPVAYLIGRALGKRITGAAAIFATLFALAPLVQVVVEVSRQSMPFPTTELSPPDDAAESTGHVEDVVVIVVDSYPSLLVADAWFGHDSSRLRHSLESADFTTIDQAWSHHVFTGLAISSLVQLEPVLDTGPVGNWGNLRPFYDLIRGENFLAGSLQSAGFEYTHIESGWDGGTCGNQVDRCVESSWVNEATWELLAPTVLHDWMASRFGYPNLVNTKRAVTNLTALADELDDGTLDYIYAHLLLPHPPLVAGADCTLSMRTGSDAEFDPLEMKQETMRAHLPQFACVDSLLADVVQLAGVGTAVVITGDHGTATQGQLSRDPATWSDADIAERLSVLLAYRFPSQCESGPVNTNIEAIRALMECTLTGLELPEYRDDYFIGSWSPYAVDGARIDRISEALSAGELAPGTS